MFKSESNTNEAIERKSETNIAEETKEEPGLDETSSEYRDILNHLRKLENCDKATVNCILFCGNCTAPVGEGGYVPSVNGTGLELCAKCFHLWEERTREYNGNPKFNKAISELSRVKLDISDKVVNEMKKMMNK